MELNRQKSGDGLRNMRRRLAAVGGKAEIRSQPGQGTEVIFELPLDSN
jgi:two-component system NarL family sensor kinase